MNRPKILTVTDRCGAKGEGLIPTSKDASDAKQRVQIRFTDGRELWVAWETLVPHDDGTYFLDLDVATLDSPQPTSDTLQDEELVMPVVAEQVKVQKNPVITGGVRVTKVVRESEEQIDEPLRQQHVDVERVTINRLVESPVEVRDEGDTMVIPVMEEVLVVEKRWMLKEEVRLHRRETESRHRQRIMLRSEEAIVERMDTPESQD